MKIKIKLLMIIGVAIMGNTYADTFSRHIYNNSGGDWRISFFPNIKGSNVNIHGCQEADVVQNGPCTISAATKVVDILYSNLDPLQRGSIDLLNIAESEDWSPDCLSYDNNDSLEEAPIVSYGGSPAYMCWSNDTVDFNSPDNGNITLNSI